MYLRCPTCHKESWRHSGPPVHRIVLFLQPAEPESYPQPARTAGYSPPPPSPCTAAAQHPKSAITAKQTLCQHISLISKKKTFFYIPFKLHAHTLSFKHSAPFPLLYNVHLERGSLQHSNNKDKKLRKKSVLRCDQSFKINLNRVLTSEKQKRADSQNKMSAKNTEPLVSTSIWYLQK